MNRPLFFANIKEPAWDSIYRRSLVIEMKGMFIPKNEYDAIPDETRRARHIFAKGETLQRFLESRPAGAAFFNTIYKYMNMNTMEAARNTIDRYAREEGATWRVIRKACNLNPLAHPLDLTSNAPEAYDEEEHRRLVDLSDALSILAIDQNTEVALIPSSLGNLWKRLAHPHEAKAPQHEGASVEFSERMISGELRIAHGVTIKENKRYCHVLRCDRTLGDIYAISPKSAELVFPEKVNREAIRKYAESVARWNNNSILREYGRSLFGIGI